MKLKKIIIAFLILIVLLMSGCSMNQDLKDGTIFVDGIYTKLKNKDYDGIVAVAHEGLLKATPTEKIKEGLATFDTKLGTIETYSLSGGNIKSTAGGSTVVLSYAVNRTLYPSTEIFTLYKEKGGEFRLVGYNVNSEGLLK
jgi:hypothetical protein